MCIYLILIFLGTNWGLDLGYTGSSGSVLSSIAMYSQDIGVAGTSATGASSDSFLYTRFPGKIIPGITVYGVITSVNCFLIIVDVKINSDFCDFLEAN